ncbi:uncharacterized protein LOC132195225 [Neocloeon triangulifer]|uniref:uncharacterized protein LOC132195225 n=1 Tax=Neocloeon triangulifer TaxID=2078957 RepID=UPI00286F77E2|nr:uncharacterized protein LOC132195225 [Neocloeon triangulifer]
MTRIATCVTLPTLIPDDVLSACKANASQQANPIQNITGRFNFKPPKNLPFGGMAGSLMKSLASVKTSFCQYECAFKNLGLLDDSGKVNVDAASKGLASAVPSEWQAAAQVAATNCSATLTSMYAMMNSSKMPTPPPMLQGGCKPCSFFFRSCVVAQLYLNAPDFSTDAKCTSDRKALSQCITNVPALLGLPPMPKMPLPPNTA